MDYCLIQCYSSLIIHQTPMYVFCAGKDITYLHGPQQFIFSCKVIARSKNLTRKTLPNSSSFTLKYSLKFWVYSP